MRDNYFQTLIFQTLIFPETACRTMVYCARCGRVLTNPKSIKRGYGPKCWERIHMKSW